MKIGLLGGTFDPIHVGHLEAATAALQELSLDRVMLIPARTPPHRAQEPRASVFHRFAMTALAAASRPSLLASDVELRREGPSYTALTLQAFREEGYTPSQLYFIAGADAFAEISTWYDYPRVLTLANFVVVSRPGFTPSRLDLMPDRDPPPPRASSITRVTGPAEGVADGGRVPYLQVLLVDARTPDVSSTDIRRRVASGESIEGLVPPAVAEHIRRHRLYVPAPVAAVL